LVVFSVAVLAVAGCTSNVSPVSKVDAAREFTSAYSSFGSGGRLIMKEDPLPTPEHPESEPPTPAEDSQIANLLDRYRKSLTSIAWPQPAARDVGGSD
jgi:hypothetical protein